MGNRSSLAAFRNLYAGRDCGFVCGVFAGFVFEKVLVKKEGVTANHTQEFITSYTMIKGNIIIWKAYSDPIDETLESRQ